MLASKLNHYRLVAPFASPALPVPSWAKIFKTMKEAEAHGLELAKEWVDKRWAES